MKEKSGVDDGKFHNIIESAFIIFRLLAGESESDLLYEAKLIPYIMWT